MSDSELQAATDQGNPFTSVPIEVTVSVGRARPMIRDLLKMGESAVLELDRKVDDPVELYVGEKLIARGILEEAPGDPAGQLCVRLVEIVDFKNGL